MIRLAWVALTICIFTTPLTAQQRPPLAKLRDNGLAALQRGDREGAVQEADALLHHYATDPVAWRFAGDLYLRGGEIQKSIAQFKRYIAAIPEHEAELWQYGIALALAGQYDAGRKLFELHRTVNPHDVENALWHFYCVAKASTAEQARAAVLPAPGDRRVPMEQLLWLYRGVSQAAAVRAEVDKLPPESNQHASARFYADLYLAMHADAVGNRAQALELAARAAAAKEVNYMTDVGRVYLSVLREAAP